MSWTTEWTSVIFSDEKRFNLDGPDGFQYYLHCLKQKEQYYSTRQQGGGSLIVWLAVGFGGRSSLVFIKGRQNHKDYIKQLETELLPYGSDWGGENWIHQQDGASIHSAQGVKKWFDDNNVQVLPWPAKSPDLNIVENVWAMLVERVYGQGRQYENFKELHESLDSVWNTFCQKDIQNLYDSMPNWELDLGTNIFMPSKIPIISLFPNFHDIGGKDSADENFMMLFGNLKLNFYIFGATKGMFTSLKDDIIKVIF
ncbi:Transposable element Tc3 transposase [Araneus ventricosus]|uniref:Transposable element Tc3 transposase n=1 Tax=Araneus ventricosus TaxID=182803 RepID=A0A4Y2D8Q4_ARAVE|nr:Transposable element Tc3 transposase [Araneus ventricosus]